MKGRLPWFPFYAGDWLASGTVSTMSLAAQGAYVRLLAVQWREGSLPPDLERLAALCGVDRGSMEDLWTELEASFPAVEGDAGDLANPRLELERRKQLAAQRRLSAAGKAGARARWRGTKQDNDLNGPVNAIAMRSQSDRNAISMAKPDTDTEKTLSSSTPEIDPTASTSQRSAELKLANRIREAAQDDARIPSVHQALRDLFPANGTRHAFLREFLELSVHQRAKPYTVCRDYLDGEIQDQTIAAKLFTRELNKARTQP